MKAADKTLKRLADIPFRITSQATGESHVILTDKNGENVNTITMLPSAFFTLQEQENGRYEIMGGGLGHGIGMSQYGADGMARAGKTAAEILQYFFPGTELFLGK